MASIAGRKADSHLLTDDLKHVDTVWLAHSAPLLPPGEPGGWAETGYVVDFRPGVEHASGRRSCGDVSRRSTESACATTTPIQMVARYHLSQIYRRVFRGRIELAISKSGQEATYNRISPDPMDMGMAVISLRRPVSGARRGFTSRTLMFGAAAAALHYNLFLRQMTDLFAQMFGARPYSFTAIFRRWRPAFSPCEDLAVFASPPTTTTTHPHSGDDT